MPDELWLFRFRYLADIFLENDKGELSLQGKQLVEFVVDVKNQHF